MGIADYQNSAAGWISSEFTERKLSKQKTGLTRCANGTAAVGSFQGTRRETLSRRATGWMAATA